MIAVLEARLAEVTAAHGRELRAARAETEAVRAELREVQEESEVVRLEMEEALRASQEVGPDSTLRSPVLPPHYSHLTCLLNQVIRSTLAAVGEAGARAECAERELQGLKGSCELAETELEELKGSYKGAVTEIRALIEQADGLREQLERQRGQYEELRGLYDASELLRAAAEARADEAQEVAEQVEAALQVWGVKESRMLVLDKGSKERYDMGY